MSPPGCQKISAKPCDQNAEESFPGLSLKSEEQKPPNPLLIRDKDVQQLGLEPTAVPFDVSANPLFYLRGKNIYQNDISSTNSVPYNIDHFGNAAGPDEGFATVEALAVTEEQSKKTRQEWCEFYQHGKIEVELPETAVFQKGDRMKDIAYWNLLFDQLGSEGYDYTAAGNGYSSNVINWNSAEAVQANNEFAAGTEYKTLTGGYSSIFSALFRQIVASCGEKDVHFDYRPNQRVHSILEKDGVIHFTTATRKDPNRAAERRTANFAFLAMPRAALELVAQATRYIDVDGLA